MVRKVNGPGKLSDDVWLNCHVVKLLSKYLCLPVGWCSSPP